MTVAALTLATLWAIVVTASRHPGSASMIGVTHWAIEICHRQPAERRAANENGRAVG